MTQTMPQRLEHVASNVPLDKVPSRSRLRDKFPFSSKLSSWRRRTGDHAQDVSGIPPSVPSSATSSQQRPVVPGLPRQLTLRRQDSERRDRLEALLTPSDERRTRRRAHSATPSLKPDPPRLLRTRSSAPDLPLHSPVDGEDTEDDRRRRDLIEHTSEWLDSHPPELEYEDTHTESEGFSEDESEDEELRQELESRWILNLSMAFRDKSDREKFFQTYAQQPNRWRRVTVSCDYRDAAPDSLEADLKSLHYQKDKSARIYESIRDSLPDIRFFDTVTNLKLETRDGRLHVHVTEDVNEIIYYPSLSAVNHSPLLTVPQIPESTVHFESHMSGFVYKVKHNGRIFVKKEIPAPDMVDEFLYELNALANLKYEPNVVQLEGVIVDDALGHIKGLLLAYASNGALVDILYEQRKDSRLSWTRRETWAKQIVNGIRAIHEKGYVQGDFTLSNIVVDAEDNARVIDINRRGCPVGWEPPEFKGIIRSGQRISMFIGVKSDLYQLGMVLWGLAMRNDEPEREELPLEFDSNIAVVPQYFQELVRACMQQDPSKRIAARYLLETFPSRDEEEGQVTGDGTNDTVCGDPQWGNPEDIDPEHAVGIDDIERHRSETHLGPPPTSGSRYFGDSGLSGPVSTAPTDISAEPPQPSSPAIATLEASSRKPPTRAAKAVAAERSENEARLLPKRRHVSLPASTSTAQQLNDARVAFGSPGSLRLNTQVETTGASSSSFANRMLTPASRKTSSSYMPALASNNTQRPPQGGYESPVRARAKTNPGPGAGATPDSDLAGVGGASPEDLFMPQELDELAFNPPVHQDPGFSEEQLKHLPRRMARPTSPAEPESG